MRKDGVLIKSSEISKLNSADILHLLGVKVEKNDTNQPIKTKTNILVAKINGLIQIVTSTNIFSNVDNFDKVENRTSEIFGIDSNAQIINYSISSATNFYFLKYYNAEKVLRSFWGMDQVNPSEYGDFICEYESNLISNCILSDDVVCYFNEKSNEYIAHDCFCDERVSKSILEYFDFEIMGNTSFEYEYYILERNGYSETENNIEIENKDDDNRYSIDNNYVSKDEYYQYYNSKDNYVYIGEVLSGVWNNLKRFNPRLVDKKQYIEALNKKVKKRLIKNGFDFDENSQSYFRIKNSIRQTISFYAENEFEANGILYRDFFAQISASCLPINYYDWYVNTYGNQNGLSREEIESAVNLKFDCEEFGVPVSFNGAEFKKKVFVSYDEYADVYILLIKEIMYFFYTRETLNELGCWTDQITAIDLQLLQKDYTAAEIHLKLYINRILNNEISLNNPLKDNAEIEKRIKMFFPHIDPSKIQKL